MFGTFQPEEEKPTYGLTKNINSFNPVVVALKTWGELFEAAMKSGSVKNGFNYFIQPPGWSHDGSTKTVRQMRVSKGLLAEESLEQCNDASNMLNRVQDDERSVASKVT